MPGLGLGPVVGPGPGPHVPPPSVYPRPYSPVQAPAHPPKPSVAEPPFPSARPYRPSCPAAASGFYRRRFRGGRAASRESSAGRGGHVSGVGCEGWGHTGAWS